MNEAPVLSDKLLETLDSAVLRQARALLEAGAVSDCRQGRLDDITILSGWVRDQPDQRFSVYATVEDGRLQGDCTCPRAHDCEHVGALFLASQEQGHKGTDEPPRTVQPIRDSQAAQKMVYLLRLSEDRADLNVCPSRFSPAVSGRGGSTTPYALSRLSDSHQPDYVLDEDLSILHQLADRMAAVTDLVWYPLAPTSQGLLRDMIATDRCHWKTAEGPVLTMAEPLAANAEWRLLPSGYQQLALTVDDDEKALALPLLPPWRLNPENGRCRVLTSVLDEALVSELLAAGPIEPARVDAVIDRLDGVTGRFPRPRRLRVEKIDEMEPIPCLHLCNVEVGSGRRFETVPAARLSFRYGQVELAWDDEFSSRMLNDEQVVMVERNLGVEEECSARLEQHRLVPLHGVTGRDYRPGEGGLWVARQSQRSSEIWIELQQALADFRSDGWLIETAADFVLELVEPDDWYGDLHARPESTDYFELDLGVSWQGQRWSLLPALLDWLERTPEAMLRMLLSGEHPSGSVTLALDDRRVVQIPMERLVATLRGLADFFDAAPKLHQGRLRLPRGRLAELAEAGRAWDFGGDQDLTELSRRLADFQKIDPMAEPEGLQAELRGYQRFGLGWLQFLREFGFGGILADDMGLGKTIQTLAHVLAEKRAGRLDQPCLVVAPTSLMFNWRAEARRFCPDLKVLMLHGPKRKGEFQWIGESDLVLTTYPLLPRDLDQLKRQSWHLLILDEAQAIKNPRSGISKSVRELSARHRLCLTGTPMENHLGELWSLFDFLMPGMLGSQARFKRMFKNPVERHDDDDRRRMLARRIRPFFLRRTKAEVAPELPPKTEIIRAVAFEGAQLRLYERVRVALHDKVRRALDTRGAERSRIVVLDALLKLRQICCDPRLLKGVEGSQDIGSAKLDLLMELLPELVEEGRRILLFSQFVSMLNLIEAEVRKHDIDFVRLTGQTRDRQKVVERFQTGQVPLFLISLKAGGVGLNLTAADTVIHYDPWWNPAVEDQATDRAHRIGQEQKVFVYKLLTEQTIEQKVFELQQSKRGLVAGLLGGGGAVSLGPEDLETLFEPLAE
jgi:superfamily II DNA or RNA helicase